VFRSGFGFGLSDLSSNTLAQISVPLANQLLGVSYAGFLGLVKPIVSFVMILPRSLSIYYIPLLVKIKMDSKCLKTRFVDYFRLNTLMLILIVVVEVVLWFAFLSFFDISELLVDNSTLIFLLLVFNLFFHNCPFLFIHCLMFLAQQEYLFCQI